MNNFVLKRLELLKNGDFSLPESDSEFSWGYTKGQVVQENGNSYFRSAEINQMTPGKTI